MRADLFATEKQYSLALENISIGLAMGPERELAARLYLQKASIQKAQGLGNEAKQSYRIAKALDPSNPVISLMSTVYE